MPSNRVRPLTSGATRNEDRPNPCEVKHQQGARKTQEMNKSIADLFGSEYKISMPLSGVAASWFERKSEGEFAFLDYDVKKGLKWSMTFYRDEGKKEVLLSVEQKKLAPLAGQSGYEFADSNGKVLGAWVPKKRFLNLFLKAGYELVVDGKTIAKSPAEGFFKLFIPSAVRKMIARNVLTADGKAIAKVRAVSTLGCGTVTVKPDNGKIPDDFMATSVAVFGAICGLQDV